VVTALRVWVLALIGREGEDEVVDDKEDNEDVPKRFLSGLESVAGLEGDTWEYNQAELG